MFLLQIFNPFCLDEINCYIPKQVHFPKYCSKHCLALSQDKMLLYAFMSSFRDVLWPLFSDSHSIRDAELRVRLHTLFIRRDVAGERGVKIVPIRRNLRFRVCSGDYDRLTGCPKFWEFGGCCCCSKDLQLAGHK